MSSNQRFDFRTKLNELAQNQARKAIEQLGTSLPASIVSITGQIATVKFEVLPIGQLPQVKIPIMGSKYVQHPFQQGDMGFVVPIDASIFTVAGMTTGTANMNPLPNLSSLVFFPIGNMKWEAVDPNTLVLTGLTDTLLRDNAHQLSLENENIAWTTLISDINTAFTAISSGFTALSTPVTLTPISATVNPVKVRA